MNIPGSFLKQYLHESYFDKSKQFIQYDSGLKFDENFEITMINGRHILDGKM